MGSVAGGMVPDELTGEIHAAAARELHPRFVELVQGAPDPFIQIILDVAVPRMTFGRACLLGDAAFVLRPHTAAATAKAAADAMALAAGLAADPGDPDAALRASERARSSTGVVSWITASPSGSDRSSGATAPALRPNIARGGRALRRDRPTAAARVRAYLSTAHVVLRPLVPSKRQQRSQSNLVRPIECGSVEPFPCYVAYASGPAVD